MFRGRPDKGVGRLCLPLAPLLALWAAMFGAWWPGSSSTLPSWPGSSMTLPSGMGQFPGTAGPAATGAKFSGNYANAAGTRAYYGYVPSTYDAGKAAVPLVVALHGCAQSADVFRKQTKFDNLAEAKGFIVVYPEQPSKANPFSCWNWFKSDHIERGQGEPSIIAGITQWAQQHYHVDAKRTYVAGFSAGAAMANVMGATYPDLFAAIGVGSGIEYNGGTAAMGGAAIDAKQSGMAAFRAMGLNAREVPTLVFHGGKDHTVPVNNADKLVQSWQTTDALVEYGAINASFPTAPVSSKDAYSPSFQSYSVKSYNDGHGREVLEYWLVPEMEHAWSGGCDCEKYSYPAGPDEGTAMYSFFMEHPMP